MRSQRALLEAVQRAKDVARERLERLELRLALLSPEQVLARGYSITRDAATGRVVRRASDVVVGMQLRTRLHEGDVTSIVARAEPAPEAGPRGSPA